MKPSIYFIVGPTAIGKSSLAIKLAKSIGGQIINADSIQVYKDLKILSARPNKNELNYINHHLYGHVSGSNRYNVAKWCEESSTLISKLLEQGITPIVVGGTGMYIDKFINGIANIPSIPELYKEKSEKLFLNEGQSNFFNIVNDIDYNSVKKIEPNDINRLKRIWEVFEYTKIPLSEWINKKTKNYLGNNEYFLYLFLPDRDQNYLRVNNRFEKMINDGAINEVKNLIECKFKKSLPIMRAHGVPEISQYINKRITLEECKDLGKRVTRNYVKRQHTWWNSSKLVFHQKFNQFPDKIDINSMILTKN